MGATLDLSHEPRSGVGHGKLGMWIFLASEIMFFAGFFSAFIVLRNANPAMFQESINQLNVALATLNTGFLISSSFTMALAILYLEKKNIVKFRLNLGITFLFSCGFLVVKYFEYSAKFHHGIGPQTNPFFAMYFMMTGFHGIHVVAGMVPMAWMFVKSFTRSGYTRADRVEVLGLYWHFVDLVWIFLFPVVYLLFK